ncbi:MAG: hypothetical protein NVSMB46_08310 [Candidatus Saccharimonadales bacterium]
MEQRPSGHESDEPKLKKWHQRAAESFFAAWMSNRDKIAETTHESDDDTEEVSKENSDKDKKYSRINIFIRRLLGNAVIKDVVPPQKPREMLQKSHSKDTDTIEEHENIATNNSEINAISPQIHTEDITEEHTEDVGLLLIDHDDELKDSISSISPAEQSNVRESMPQNNEKPVIAEPSNEEERVRRNYHSADSQSAENQYNHHSRDQEIAKLQPVEQRRSHAFLAFLGAEYLSRGRDRKIRRQIVALKERTRENEKAHDRIRQLTIDTRNIRAEVKSKERHFAKHILSSKEIKTVPMTLVNEQRPSTINRLKIKSEKPLLDTAKGIEIPKERRELQQQTSPEIKHEINTRVIPNMEKVQETVESVVPIEKIYERRHEVKDDGYSKQSVTASYNQITPQYQPLSLASTNNPHALGQSMNPKATNDDEILYKKAMKSGVLGGIIVIVLYMVIVYMTH